MNHFLYDNFSLYISIVHTHMHRTVRYESDCMRRIVQNVLRSLFIPPAVSISIMEPDILYCVITFSVTRVHHFFVPSTKIGKNGCTIQIPIFVSWYMGHSKFMYKPLCPMNHELILDENMLFYVLNVLKMCCGTWDIAICVCNSNVPCTMEQTQSI